jgi:UDP-N-acetylmuramate: L-alanyl-gamma-D-glutamyl-meso-diaminopimelate ligase
MKLHFIAIGGSAMHNLAIALQRKGIIITGSDDEIFEPSKSRLEKYGLMPINIGWDTKNIHKDIDAVILGMHARADNPELLKANELGLKIYSYPEYIYEQTKNKIRIVVGGSHGKTSITSMIIHVMQFHHIDIDYMVGAQLQGFDCMVKLTVKAKYAVIEGDEYLSSPIDRRPKFHLYKPDVAIISGIAWDHINVFPTFENYVEQFDIFANLISDDGALIYAALDKNVEEVANRLKKSNVTKLPYRIHPHIIENGITFLKTYDGNIALKIFGDHNLQNLNAAKLACSKMGVTHKMFYEAIQSFRGASKRMELVHSIDDSAFYKDFAHSPSKLKATTEALQKQYPNRKLIAVMELHTFSSLNQEFLLHYKDSMENADEALVYFSPHTVEHKKLQSISPELVKQSFGKGNVSVYTSAESLHESIISKNWSNTNLLMMSSGTFDGLDIKKLSDEIYGN